MICSLGLGCAAFVLAIAAGFSGQWLLAGGDAMLVAVNVAVFEVNRRRRRGEVLR